MAKQKNRTKHTTAAYAASQPLFDAVRTTQDHLSAQESHLKEARFLVQKLHVDLKDHDSSHELGQHERYMDACVKAFRVAVESYGRIFAELAKVTGPDAEKGKGKQKGWEAFVSVRDVCVEASVLSEGWETKGDLKNRAEMVAEEYGKGEEQREECEGVDGSESERSGVEAISKTEGKNKHNKQPAEAGDWIPSAERPGKLTEKVVTGKSGTVLWDEGAEKLSVPYASMGSDERRAWHHEKQRQKREKKRDKRDETKVATAAAKNEAAIPDRRRPAPDVVEDEDTSKPEVERNHVNLNGDEPEPMDAEPTDAAYIEYENVDSEVEKRLKAKEKKMERDEAQYRTKKAEKKRKRESAGSTIEPTKGGAMDSAVAAEKPKKKRSRIHEEEAEQPAGEDETEKKDRKKRVKEVEQSGEGGERSRKKRKKKR